MTTELIDTIESLTMIMAEETAWIEARGARFAGHAALTDAKLNLVAALEREMARIERGNSTWLDDYDGASRAVLEAAIAALAAAARPNARLLLRQIDLSTDLMTVVATEAQRATGNRSTSYGEFGTLTMNDVPAPISINASL